MPYHCSKLNKFGFHVGALELDERALVFHLVAVVGSAEDGDHAAIRFDFVALVLDFVRPDEQF